MWPKERLLSLFICKFWNFYLTIHIFQAQPANLLYSSHAINRLLVVERAWENKQKIPQTSAFEFLHCRRNTLRTESPVPSVGRVRTRNKTMENWLTRKCKIQKGDHIGQTEAQNSTRKDASHCRMSDETSLKSVFWRI